MSESHNLEHDLRLVHADLRAITDLAERVRKHPRYPELCRIADEGRDPDHPGVVLAAWLTSEDDTGRG